MTEGDAELRGAPRPAAEAGARRVSGRAGGGVATRRGTAAALEAAPTAPAKRRLTDRSAAAADEALQTAAASSGGNEPLQQDDEAPSKQLRGPTTTTGSTLPAPPEAAGVGANQFQTRPAQLFVPPPTPLDPEHLAAGNTLADSAVTPPVSDAGTTPTPQPRAAAAMEQPYASSYLYDAASALNDSCVAATRSLQETNSKGLISLLTTSAELDALHAAWLEEQQRRITGASATTMRTRLQTFSLCAPL